MTNSQKFIPIAEIKDNLVFLKDGTVTLVITTSAVNFSLLFETEQISIIETFAGLLNSLSFPVQIVIRSRRLDVSSYLTTLDKAQSRQTNPLLKQLTANFRKFVEGIIKENDVLDKQFYLCLNIGSLELGVISKKGLDKAKKAAAVLTPRRDHLIHQLSRLGLKSRQLNTEELVKLYYDIYNQEDTVSPAPQEPVQPTVSPTPQPQILPHPQTPLPPQAPLPPQSPAATTAPVIPSFTPVHTDLPNIPPPPRPTPTLSRYPAPSPLPISAPFVVEELTDERGP